MTDPRILHAAARGARIEVQGFDGVWRVAEVDKPIRVRKADQHLMYGPISSVIRETALLDDDIDNLDTAMFHGALRVRTTAWLEDWYDYKYADTETRRMFLLILAEELSYDGL